LESAGCPSLVGICRIEKDKETRQKYDFAK